jgi:peptide/nickel transport system ATP-binding protein
VAPLLEITDLHTEITLRRKTVHAVDGVSLTVDRGETLGVVGESGCGKTMTALSVMRLLPPGGAIASGRIDFDGQDLAALSTRAVARVRGNRIGMVFQDPLASLNPTMTIGAQITEAVRLHRPLTRTQARRRAVEVLDLARIPAAAKRLRDYPHQFSGGMRQRVMIAMALVCEPDLLIADEPTTALDVTTQQQILGLFDELRAELHMALILVTHDLGVIAGRADRVSVMYAGRIVESAAAAELFSRPRHRYTEALFRALPDGARRMEGRLENIPGLPPDLAAPPDGCRFAPRCRHATDECRVPAPAFAPAGADHPFSCVHPATEPLLSSRRVPVDLGGPVDESTDAVLVGRNLVKEFASGSAVLRRRRARISAVAGVSLQVLRGETFGLVGESGCGKSTLSRLLVALDRPTAGSVLLEGRDLAAMSARALRGERRELQLVFQDSASALDPRMRIGSILAEPLRIQQAGGRREQRQTVTRLLDDVGMPASSMERYPHEFSGGQRQRLALARALALRPKVVVADEPVSALDVSVQAQILNLMADIQQQHGLTYVLVSHDLAVVRYLADRIGVMYLGKLVEVGPRDEVYERPLHPYTRGLVDSVPVPDPAIERGKPAGAVGGELPPADRPPSGCRFRTRCPLAEEICAEVEPPHRPTPDGRHTVACHFPLGGVLAGSASDGESTHR